MKPKDALLASDWKDTRYQVLREDGMLRFYRVGNLLGVSSLLLQDPGCLRPAGEKDIFIPESEIAEWKITEFMAEHTPWRLMIRTERKKYAFYLSDDEAEALRGMLSETQPALVDMSDPAAERIDLPWLKPLLLGLTIASAAASFAFMVLDGIPHSIWERLCLAAMLLIPLAAAGLHAALPAHVSLISGMPKLAWQASAYLAIMIPSAMMAYEMCERNITNWLRLFVCAGLIWAALTALLVLCIRRDRRIPVSWLLILMLALYSLTGTAVANCVFDPHPPQVRQGVVHKLRKYRGTRRSPGFIIAVVYDDTGYHEWELNGTMIRETKVSTKVEVQVYRGLFGVECVHVELPEK